MIEKIDQEESGRLYKEHIKQDFPKDRKISYKKIIKNLERDVYDIYLYNDKPHHEQAYAICIDVDDYIIIHYFSVFPEYRNNGIGKQFLEELAAYYKNKKGLIVAARDVLSAKDGAEKLIRQRVIHFYEKADFQLVQEIKYKCFGEQYTVLVHLLKEHFVDASVIAQTIRASYKKFLNRFLLKRVNIKVLM